MTVQYKRRWLLAYGDQDGSATIPFVFSNLEGESLRVQFEFSRNNQAEADRGVIRIYGLSENLTLAIKEDLETQWRLRRDIQNNERDPVQRGKRLKVVADTYRVNFFVGYEKDSTLKLLFRGDLVGVKTAHRAGSLEPVTTLELGDTLLALRDSYMHQIYGTGSTLENVIRGSAAVLDAPIDKASAEVLITAIGPNAAINKIKNGYVAIGRVGDTLTELIDLFGLQWWIRDGTIYFVPQFAVVNDYTLVLREGVDLLDHTRNEIYDNISGRALINADLFPGRGLILKDVFNEKLDQIGFRVNRTKTTGDTRGQSWYTSFEASAMENSILAPTLEFSNSAFTGGDLLDQLERRFQ